MGKLSKKINEAKNVNLDDQEIEGMIEKVKDELESAKNNIEPMIRKMKEKISHYGCDFQLAVNNEQRENEKKEQEQEMIFDLTNNKELLDKRRKDLQDIHSTADQIKQMTDKMAMDLKEQGAILNDIENKVTETEDNAKKSKEEIMQADKMSKSNRKRAIFFIIIILVALGGMAALIFGLVNYFKK